MKILIVHHHASQVEEHLSQLMEKETVITKITSGLEGLFTSRMEKFDLIICGTELPVVTGYELVRSLRTYSVNKDTPVIFIADEINYKSEKLSQALGVANVLALQEASALAELVSSHMNNDKEKFNNG